ncbi:alpha/beta fold hydrolase [Streptomyces sp. NBRC 110035]|uniref:alpha/beta fold hydrolase n=1 Tax=Streptomyces sp. NBRC 110035 TaxID=1547867 RepID=UPI0005A684C7|nr:alpha/beta hydrolase [Streptomyces sp. NBRC 110035]
MPETIESFLCAVHRTYTEVTRREPGYFATRPLRAGDPPTGAAEAVADAFGVTLTATDPAAFTAVDELLDRRRRTRPDEDTDDVDPGRAAGHVPAGAWRAWRQRQDRQGALRAARAAHLGRSLERRVVRHAGRRLRYRVGGRGPMLVLLTALGHTDEVWHPLAERLLPGRRLVMWDAGETAPSGQPWLLDGHLTDIDAVLDAEGAASCDVVGWCSGAQIALEYAHSRPSSVRALVLLHGSYPRAAGDACSAYERDLGAVCASVAARPGRAQRALRMLTGGAVPEPLPADEGRAAVEVLARAPAGVESVLRRPFRDPDALVRYSRQLTELWQRPLPGPASGLPPLLSLAADLDRVAAPEPPAALMPLLAGRHGELVGATHYTMIDRPEVVAAVCGAFLDDPSGGAPLATGPAEIRWAPCP